MPKADELVLMVVDSDHRLVSHIASWLSYSPNLLFCYMGDMGLAEVVSRVQHAVNDARPAELTPVQQLKMASGINGGVPLYVWTDLDEVRQRQEVVDRQLSVKEAQAKRAEERKQQAKERAEKKAREKAEEKAAAKEAKETAPRSRATKKRSAEELELAAAHDPIEESQSPAQLPSPAPKRHGPGGGLPRPPPPQPPRARKVPYQQLPSEEREHVATENREYLRQMELAEAVARGESVSHTGQTHAQQDVRIRRLSETIPDRLSSEEETEDPVPAVVRYTTPPHRGSSSRSSSRGRISHSAQGPSPASMLQRRLWEAKSSSRSPSGGRPPSKDPE